MNRCCSYCMSAYIYKYDGKIHCINKEFEAQFCDVTTSVKPSDVCCQFEDRTYWHLSPLVVNDFSVVQLELQFLE